MHEEAIPMTTVEKILESVRELPEQLQDEVLDFVQFLKLKSGAFDDREEDLEWSKFSLMQAMRGMEDEDWSHISEDDIKR
jgi:hypothetical protein